MSLQRKIKRKQLKAKVKEYNRDVDKKYKIEFKECWKTYQKRKEVKK